MNEGKAPAAATPAAPASPIRLANLNTFNPKTSLHFADTYVFRGTSPKQQPFGELFVVVQVDHATPTSPQVADAIATILQHEYYRGNPNESAKNFEDALHKTNEILSDLAARGEIHWIGKLHGIVAVVQRDTIHVSATGRGKAFLVRGNDIADIAEGLYDAGRPASPMKTYEHLASGELKDGDVVLLATPGISETITPQHLRQLLRGNTPEDAASEIQARVGRNPAAANSGVVVRYDRRQAPAVQQAPVRAAKPKPSPITPATPLAPAMPTPSEEPDLAPVIVPTSVPATVPAGRKAFSTFAGKVRGSIANLQARRAAKAKSAQPVESTATGAEPTAQASTTEKAPNKFATAVRTAWGRLPRRARRLTIGAVALVFVFVVSLVAFSNARQGAASREEVAAKLSQAKDLEQQVAAAIIFKDFGQAQTLLTQAEALISEVPEDGATKTELDLLRAAIAADKEKLTGNVKVGQPTVLASLAGRGEPRGIALLGSTLVVWTATGDVVTVPVAGGEPGASEEVESSLGQPLSGAVDEDRVVVLTDEGELVALEDAKVDGLDVSGTFAPAKDAALATYGNRLYVLDAGENQITRHSRTVAGYGQGDEWILDETSVEDGVDLAVDGDLWVLTSAGKVVKFRSGNHADFTLGQASDPLTSPTRIVTAENDAFLYILEPAKKRLLQYEKESGDFVKQYTSDAFGTLADVVVNEKGHAAYVLSGDQVLKVELQS